MPKKKATPTTSIRISGDVYRFLKELADKDPIKPSVAQLIGKLVRTQGHTLQNENNRPG